MMEDDTKVALNRNPIWCGQVTCLAAAVADMQGRGVLGGNCDC